MGHYGKIQGKDPDMNKEGSCTGRTLLAAEDVEWDWLNSAPS